MDDYLPEMLQDMLKETNMIPVDECRESAKEDT